MKGSDMRKSTKGALAAGAAGALLLGGAGSLAYWQSTQTITGGDINSGHLALVTDVTNTGCAGWRLDTAGGSTSYNDGDPLVPGDVLTNVCTYTISASGNHLRATVGVDAPNFSGTDGDFGGALSADVSNVKVNGISATSLTSADDGDALTATITVTFDSTAGNSTEDLATVLDDLTLTADQVHS
jgi:alternate signal-mediated exported protein